ncbi:Cytochrome P450, family 98, subfamily A, polypeptide 8/9 [Heracleum sosnowskyi]|uniref:Cytochrome P450, family 98, subfamily A, polypeptide 8/9 n=1 Tax=Heracleum sosnowskyi TaxID=360622 RepID=A0AAD8IH05_9APIA|nr:Cytochrome P450, family 98, subfamily A, polypeptide 8/9 [Heracleum sosnowskyi]
MFKDLQATLYDTWSWWWLLIDTNDLGYALAVTASILLVFSLLTLVFSKSKKISHPLPPGPRSFPLVGNLLSLDPDLHTYFASLGKSYGPIVTLWLGHKVGIVINSPVIAREVLKDQDTTFANRDVPAAGIEATYGGMDIVWTPYGPKWRMLRRVCVSEMLSKTTLDSVYDLRRKEFRQTIGYFYSQNGLPVDVGEQLFLTIMNVITNMMWGNTVKGKDRAGLGTEFRLVVNEMTHLLGTPNVSDFYPGLARFDLQGIRKKMKVLAKKFDDIFETMIKKRQEMDGQEGSKDFLQFLLKLKDNQDAKEPFSMTHLKSLLMDMVVGGTDTTSNSMEFALAEMLNKPQTMQKKKIPLVLIPTPRLSNPELYQ